MRKLIFVILLAFIVFFIQAKHAEASKSNLTTELRALSGDEIFINLIIHGHTHPGNISLQAEVSQQGRLVARGVRRMDILSLPTQGIKIRIPLSNNISSKANYTVSVSVENTKYGKNTKIWKGQKVSSYVTNGFLSKTFKAIPEPFNIRSSIKPIRIRGELGIL